MILPERVLGRPGAHWMASGAAIGPISLRTWATRALLQIVGRLDPGVQGDIGVDALALDVVGETDDGGLGHVVVQDQGALDLGGAHAVARDVDDVVDPAGDPVIAVLVAAAAVAGEILAGIGREIGLEEPLVIAPDGAHLAGPAVGDAQIAARPRRPARRPRHRPVPARRPAGAWSPSRASGPWRRAGARPGCRRSRSATRCRRWAAAVADDLVIPAPGLGIDRLADAAQQAQRRAAGRLHRLVAVAHQGPQRGRGGVEDLDLVLVDHLPEAAGCRDSWARPRTSGSSRHWPAGHRRNSCGR